MCPNITQDDEIDKSLSKSRKRKREDSNKVETIQEIERVPSKKKRKRKRKKGNVMTEAENNVNADIVEEKRNQRSSTGINVDGHNHERSRKKLQPWIISSKNVEIITGEDNIEMTEHDAQSSTEEINSNVKSKRAKEKNEETTEGAKQGELDNENKSFTDNGIESSKKKKKKRKNKNKSQSLNLSKTLQTDDTDSCNNDEECKCEESQTDMTEWKNLYVPDEILKALQDLKFSKPTVIQRQALPSAIRDRKDILGAAETGSGKTLAFGIPLLSRLLDAKRAAGYYEDNSEKSDESSGDDVEERDSAAKKIYKKPPMALILEPTRELAVQVRKHLEAVSKYTKIKFANVLGGMSVEKQRRVLGKQPEVIIATPGRLWQLIEEGNEHLCQVDRVLCLVLDEADRLVEKGHYEELTKLLELLNKSPRRAKNRQTFVMSATLTMDISAPKRLLNKGKKVQPEEDKIKSLIEKTSLSGKPSVIDLTPAVKVAQTLTELRVNCKADEKDFYLYYFLCQHPGRTLVFANSKDCLRRLVAVFTLLQCSPLPLHADMHQRQRLKNLDRFSENKRGLLIASDVAARGLDIPHVDHVIHYQVPRTMENYVHRSGRTARASNLGLSVMLVGPEDAKNYQKIIHGVRKDIDLPLLPLESDLMPAVKQRVSLARDVDVKEYRLKKKKVKNNFFIKAAEEMDMIIDDDRLLEDLGDQADQAQEKQQLAQMKAKLERVLQGGLAPLRMTKYPTKSGQLAVKTVIDLYAR
ncbi:ATP-dependent RNA helicase MAK5 [Elysia marginata]|uniref:ATP-dependent RNA helicase n=1 Tax=Elysia marginata TaxID=1093978 RepID=A0AAV4EY70_9GAST|nr:ATP-dependent RNA helicase MAK5 [Elysia marginata]